VPVLALILCIGICANIAVVRSDQPFGDVVIEPGAENIVLFLKANFQADEDYAIAPVSASLAYYFQQYDLSSEHLADDLPHINASRLLMVVLEPDYTVESTLALLSSYGLNTDLYSAPRRIAQFETASLWELTR
jgi:hypothetical protein